MGESPPEGSATIPLRFNRKAPRPSLHMHPSDGKRYRCAWIEDSITIHSDGNVTCGLDDPNGNRSFGNINRQSVSEIFTNPEYEELQRKLWAGHRCTECGLYQHAPQLDNTMPPSRHKMPVTAIIEPTVRCNIRCVQQACFANNDPTIRTRDSDMLGLEPFTRMVDEIAGHLRDVYFFNYGDPFVHAQAEDMLTYLRLACPDVRVVTSTNGIPLAKPERARKVAEARLELIVFTIGGVLQESYSRYHVGGRVDLALQGMINVAQAKRDLALTKPIVHWRYLTFSWNDSEAEIEEALRLVRHHGIDEFTLYLTHEPPHAVSFRFSPGGPMFSRYRRYLANSLGYTHVIPAPDRDGFYQFEHTAIGPARWTGWQAQRRLSVRNNRATLAVSTLRPPASERVTHVFLVTAWEKLKVPLLFAEWRYVELHVPDHIKIDVLDIELVTFDHWFPAEELGNGDLRCLGVLVQEDGHSDIASKTWRGSEPLTGEEESRLAEFRYSAPQPLIDDNAGRLRKFD